MSRIAIVSLAALAAAFPALAADLHVTPGQSIQAAINAAQSGDRVLVQPGTYVEYVQFPNFKLEVIGVGGADVTTIDVSTLSSTGFSPVWMTTSPGLLRGFRVTGGTGTSFSMLFRRGGGVFAPNGGNVIEDCVIEGNTSFAFAGQGGGVYLGANHVGFDNGTMRRCVVRNNASQNGGGVYGGHLEHCLVEGNSATTGGGVANPELLRSCRLIGNTAVEGGGAYFHSNAPFEVTATFDTLLRGNTAQSGAGCYARALGEGVAEPVFKIENLRLENNVASISGGGIECNIFGIGVGSDRDFLVRDCTFLNNAASQSGGSGIHYSEILQGGPPTASAVGIDRCTFDGDDAVLAASAHAVTNSIFRNVAVPLVFLAGTATVDSCIVPLPYPGTGSFNADPAFFDSANGDFHLTAGSPALDLGVATSNGVAPVDFEGDAPMGPADVGADERAPHMYVTGDPTPGGGVDLRVVGPPGTKATLFLSTTRLATPIATGAGPFGLGFPIWFNSAIPLGTIPASGILNVSETIPTSISRFATLHAQVLLQQPSGALQLTNVETVVIL